MTRTSAAVILLAAVACGDERPSSLERTSAVAPEGPVTAAPATPPEPTPTPPTPVPTVAPRAGSSSADLGASRAEPHACARIGASRSIVDAFGASAAVGLPVGHVVAANVVDGAGESLRVVVVDEAGRSPREVARFAIAPALAASQLVPPGLARLADDRVALATVDASRRLVYLEVDLTSGNVSGPLALTEAVADSRFPPSIAVAGTNRLVAYTKFGNPQHVEVVVVDATPAFVRRHDITTPFAGAASPSFIRDVSPPSLVSVDPREALSLSHSLSFDESGNPAGDRSLQPIISLATPARITAVRGATDSALFFLAHGESGGVGVYLLDVGANSITPRTVVAPSRGGRPWVDALGASFGAIVVATVPREDDAAAKQVVVRLVDAEGLGPELRIEGPPGVVGSAFYPTPTRDDEGHLAVVYTTGSGIGFTRLACLGNPP